MNLKGLYKLHKKNKFEFLNFVVTLLDAHNIDYWLTDGTLLGIVRDKKLIEWDDDIDIAILYDANTISRLRSILYGRGFSEVKYLLSMDCIHFDYEDHRLDIGIYKQSEEDFSICWKGSPDGIKKYLFSIANRMFNLEYNSSSASIYNFVPRYLIKSIPFRFRDLFYKYIAKHSKTYKASFPYELLSFTDFNLGDFKYRVPMRYELYLEYLYGDWKTPNKKYNWINDTKNLVEIFDEQ